MTKKYDNGMLMKKVLILTMSLWVIFTTTGFAKVKIEEPHVEGMLTPSNSLASLKESTYQESDWGTKYIQVSKLWKKGYTGKGIKVAILDTGVDRTHPDLKGNVRGGVSFVKGIKSYNDDHGHGTHVAGIIAAKNNKIGYVGVAPDAQIYAVKVLNKNGEGTVNDIVKGLNWSIQNHMNIINMSLGLTVDEIGKKNFELLDQTIKKAYSKGILIVAAAGNDGTKEINYPANFRNVIAVGALVENEKNAQGKIYHKRDDYSNYGRKLEFSAPGSFVFSTYPRNMVPVWTEDRGYEMMSGTSMASPYVAGFLAVLKQRYPTYSNQTLRMKLRYYTKDLGVRGRDEYYGYGVIQGK